MKLINAHRVRFIAATRSIPSPFIDGFISMEISVVRVNQESTATRDCISFSFFIRSFLLLL